LIIEINDEIVDTEIACVRLIRNVYIIGAGHEVSQVCDDA
jgi:hypothetical protein